MDFQLTPEEEAFRSEVRRFLDDNLPATDLDAWLRKVRERRWVGFSWPREVGGGGGSLMEQVILKEEMTRRKAPPLGTCMMGLAWVGPAIIQYGTDEQKRRFIPDILDSRYHWCTGYSEPGSGSDLASLQCRAVREGDAYVVNGQKIWTSLASLAKWMILLVRTDPHARVKHEGITCLLVEMSSPGLTVRPIVTMGGDAFFAEVFFDGVRVPAENRLGAEGQGWQVTLSSLASERSSIAEVEALQRKLEQILDLARRRTRNGLPALADAGVRRRLARIETRGARA